MSEVAGARGVVPAPAQPPLTSEVAGTRGQVPSALPRAGSGGYLERPADRGISGPLFVIGLLLVTAGGYGMLSVLRTWRR